MQPHTLLLAPLIITLCSLASTPSVSQASEQSVRTVQMPFDPDDLSDSEFLRHILLTHGLALEGDDNASIGVARFQQFVASIARENTRTNPYIKDVSDQFSLSLLKGELESTTDLSSVTYKVPKKRLLWWITASESSSIPATDIANTQPGSSEGSASKDAEEAMHSTSERTPDGSPAHTPGVDEQGGMKGDTERLSTIARHRIPPPPSAANGQPEIPAPTAPMAGMDSTTAPVSPLGATEEAEAHGSGKPLIKINDDVPEGFESLSGPQFMFVDIFFNDAHVGSTGITITDGIITFENPEEVTELLQSKVSDPALGQWLAAPLPANGHLACYATNDPEGCGQVEADPLALIYNAVLLRLDIFITPESQRLGSGKQAQYLPDPLTQGSGIISVHGVASDLSAAPSRMDLTVGALLSYGRGHLSTNIQYDTKTENRSINTLNLTHHFNRYELNAGTFGHSAGGALNDFDLIGVGFSSSLQTRIDLEQAFSSQLPVYLPRRAVVQLLVNDRIYSGASYAAGNQLLDTTALPDGTYEVEIVINDSGTEQRRERRLFTKSALIPPAGSWLLSATAGAVRDSSVETLLPEASNINAGGVSAARRIGDQAAYRLGVLQYDDTSIAQSEFLYLGPRWSFNIAMSLGENELKAASIQSTLKLRDHHISLNATHFSSSVISIDDSPSADFFLPDNTRFDLNYQRNLPWISYGASIGIGRESIVSGLAADTDNTAGINTGVGLGAPTGVTEDRETRTFSVFAQRPILRTRHRRGFIGIRYQQDDQQSNVQLSLNLYFGISNWRARTGASLSNSSDQGTQWETSASAGWRSDNLAIGAVSTDAYVTNSSELNTYGLSTELRHAWFRANASSDFTHYANESTTRNSIASFSAHAGFDSTGVGLGGGDIASAGMIIDVSGEPDGERVDVLVNNARVDQARIGSPLFIGLQPFDQYNIKLKPRSVMGNGIGDTSHTLTLFPGNIGRLSLRARRQALLIAMVYSEAGKAIENAVVTTSTNTLLIDDSGLLQAEVHQGEVLEVREQDGSICHITVDIPVMDDVVVPDEPLVCRPRALSATATIDKVTSTRNEDAALND